jgi:hypothetical protein
MSDEYEMTMTALGTLPEKDQKLAMVKNKLLEEESKKITKRNVMKQEFQSDTVTAFSSHWNDQWSNWKRNEDGSPFPYNCYNCGIRGHKRSNCRKPAKYNGNYCGDHHSGNNYGGHCFHGNQHDGKKLQPR